MIKTNAIRAFSDKVRAVSASKAPQLQMTIQEANMLNYEIENLMAVLLETTSSTPATEAVDIEVIGTKF